MASTMDHNADEVDPYETARQQLQRLRDLHDVRQEDLAAALGIPQPRVSERLTGRSRMTLLEVHRLARYFGVSPAVFFEPPAVLARRKRINAVSGSAWIASGLIAA